MSARRAALPALTGLRFIAAAVVVLFHLIAAIPRLADMPGARHVGIGYVGVSLFFVLSGFVLAYNYLTPGRGGVADVRSFLVARLARVYPVYLLGITIALPILARELLRDAPDRLLTEGARITGLAVALLQAWVPDAACRLNCPGWSLSAEALFYLAFPLLAIPLARCSVRALCGVLASAWGASLLAGTAYLVLRPDGVADATPFTRGHWLEVLRYNPVVRLPEFVAGVALGLLYLRRVAVPERAHTGPTGTRNRGAGLALLALSTLVLGVAVAPALPYPLVHTGLFVPIFAALIYALALGGGPLGTLLRTRPAQLLGEASYALYILHVPFYVWFKKGAGMLGGDIDRDPLLPLAYLVSVQLLAIVVFLAFEEPVRVILRRRFAAPRTEARAIEPEHASDAPSAAAASTASAPASTR